MTLLTWGLMLAAVPAVAAQDAPASPARQTIRTRVPQAHIDGYIKDCDARAPHASCWCVVEKLNATTEGQFVLDIIGLAHVAEPTKANALAAVNRHGLRASQAKAILDRSDAILKAATDSCA